jgi:hypothetical protein
VTVPRPDGDPWDITRRFREAAATSRHTQIPNVEDLWYLEERAVDDDVAGAMPASLFIIAHRPPRGIVSDAAE